MIRQALPTSDAVERAVAAVFARPEFAPRPGSPFGRWLRDLWRGVREFIAGLLPQIDLSRGSERLIYWLVIAAICVSALVIAAYLVRAAARGWRSRDRSRGAGPTATVATGPARAEAWEGTARAAAAAGRWREAALSLYQALLLRLDERGAVRYDPAKTPGEYRREARREAAALRVLDTFLRPFEPAAYGGRTIDAETYASLRAAAAEAGAHG